jgi:uncharacterized protein
METMLTGFVRALRNAEVRVSPAETLDAVRATDLVGYDDRERLRQVLSATLAKSIEEKPIFDKCFARYFAWRAPSEKSESGENSNEAAPRPERNLPGGSGSDRSGVPSLFDGDEFDMQLAIENAAREADIESMRTLTQRGRYVRRMLLSLGWEQLQEEIRRLEQPAPDQQPRIDQAQALRRNAAHLLDRVKEYVERRYLQFNTGDERELGESVLRSARLSNLERGDLARINRLVQRIARKLAMRHSHRKRTFRRGTLDVPRTLKRGMAHNGLLFEPRWKSVRRNRPSLIALCDVSGSVRAYARFLLLFLYSLNDVLPRVRSFVFSSRVQEVTALFDQNSPEAAVELAQRKWGGGSTDYAVALRGMLAEIGRDLDRGATVVILGDGRNNRGDPAIDAMRELGLRSKHLIWLCPESEAAWGSGDSEMLRYRGYCTDARVCQSLAHLEHFASDLLRRAW